MGIAADEVADQVDTIAKRLMSNEGKVRYSPPPRGTTNTKG
jgi:hypothetical protein